MDTRTRRHHNLSNMNTSTNTRMDPNATYKIQPLIQVSAKYYHVNNLLARPRASRQMDGVGERESELPAIDAAETNITGEQPSSASTAATVAASDNNSHEPLPSTVSAAAQDRSISTPATVDRRELLHALEVVERDSAAIAESFSALFSSLRIALSEVTGTSLENMRCFSDVVGRLQESVLDAATKGNRYINSYLRLNEEMKGMEGLEMQLKALRKNVDALETAVNHLLRFP